MTVLLDANVLIALLVDDHVHHVAAENWFVGTSGNFATCPITQGSLMRLLIREGQSAATAQAVLNGATGDARHPFSRERAQLRSGRSRRTRSGSTCLATRSSCSGQAPRWVLFPRCCAGAPG